MQLSQRAQQSAPSMTMKLFALANDMKAAGHAMVPMIAGEPDFPTPANIGLAGIKAIATGNTKFTAASGTLALRQAIAHKFRSDNGIACDAEQVIAATGTKPLLFSAFMAICDPGTEVIVPSPYWVSYPSIVRLAGANVVDLQCLEADDFKVRPANLRAAITPATRILLLNSPGNPSGAVYTRDEMMALLDVLREHPAVYVVTDEIYEHLIYDGQPHLSPAALAPDLAERIVTINGFSKGYGMIGWRLGFATGPKPVMRAMADFLSHLLGAPNTITQAAAMAALDEPQPYLQANRLDYQGRRDLALERVNQIAGLSCRKPLGAFFLFVNCQQLLGKTSPRGAHIVDDTDFCRVAIEEAGVALVPGSAFGTPGYFRLSYSMSANEIKVGIDKLGLLCRSLA